MTERAARAGGLHLPGAEHATVAELGEVGQADAGKVGEQVGRGGLGWRGLRAGAEGAAFGWTDL
ncbi:hypothetical protein [Streptomyces roseoviridis]|uniref:Uncharacterized protein n=1 Tax=Streptomyces roseoviridis TaxID=67361 RepID=A0ABV5QXS7_9ACTN